MELLTKLVCADLGQAADYTAIGALEREPTRDVLRQAERPELKTPYPTIALRLATLSAKLDGCPIVLDATGVGRPVVDMVRLATRSLVVPVMITGGSHVTRDESGYWHVPKKVLVATVAVAMQNATIAIPKALPLAPTIEAELRNFKLKQSASGHTQFEAWRSGDHDDLVLMLALGLWYSSRLARPAPTDTRSAAERERVEMRARHMARLKRERRERERWR